MFGLGDGPPSLPTIEDFLDGGPRSPQPPPPPTCSFAGNNLLGAEVAPVFPTLDDFNVRASIRAPPTNISTRGIGNDLFGSQAASAIRENEPKNQTQQEVDNFLYELPDTMPDLELGHGLLNTLGIGAQNLFDSNGSSIKKEKEDEILKGIMDEYKVDKIRDTMDETGQVPDSIYFFHGGESEQFVNALEFIGLSPINREFSAFCYLTSADRQ